nr:hypothetical protein [Tanacetum cinerariifolium]
MIPLGQKNTLAEYMILSGADNHPPMLDKDLYDSWKSQMKLYMQNREHERMILESVENNPLIWPTVEENGETNIILQGLPADIYSLVSHHKVAMDLWERVQLLMQECKSDSHGNISNYGCDVISEVPHSETYLNDMENQGVHAMQDFEQTRIVDFTDNEIHSDNNIIPYSQYLQETQQENVQDTSLQAQQDSMILSMIEQMSKQMINHVNN